MAKTHSRYQKEQSKNKTTYYTVLERLSELFINMFKWENLPETIDVKFLEKTLLYKGYILYFDDDVLGNLALPCIIGGRYNVYNIPTRREVIANNGYRALRTIEDSVIIFNSYLRTVPITTLKYYAKTISEIQRTIEVNLNAHKTPITLSVNDANRLTIENAYAQYEGNSPVIITSDSLDLSKIQTLNTSAPYILDKLYNLKNDYWNEALAFCGNAPINTKRERIITDEIAATYSTIEAQRKVMLNARQDACEKINRMFGTNIWVEFESSFTPESKAKESESDNGNIYN